MLFDVFFNDTSTTDIYTYGHTRSLHDALPISSGCTATAMSASIVSGRVVATWMKPLPSSSGYFRCQNLPCTSRVSTSRSEMAVPNFGSQRSEEHTSELQSLMRISYAVFCLQKKNTTCRNYVEYNTLIQT